MNDDAIDVGCRSILCVHVFCAVLYRLSLLSAACLFWIPWETMPVAAFVVGIVVRTFIHTGERRDE